MTEMCFTHCADNFFSRELSTEESSCLDKCVLKFSNVNQRVMSAYVHDQAIINERRMKEMEEQVKANEAAIAASMAATDTTTAPDVLTAPSNDMNSIADDPNSNTKAPIFKMGDVSNQNQSQNLVT